MRKYRRGRQIVNIIDFLDQLGKSQCVYYSPSHLSGKVLHISFLYNWQFGMIVGHLNRGSFFVAEILE